MKWLRCSFFVGLVLGAAAPVAAWTTTSTPGGPLNDSEEPGSALVFYRFERGPAPGGVGPKTQFHISVTCPNDLVNTCLETGDSSTGQPVFLRAHWVCPGDKTGTCNELDFPLSTTVFGTVEFDADGEEGVPQAPPPPPCDRGYLIVWVVDSSNHPISFDGLIGRAVIRGSSSSFRAYNALSIQAGAVPSGGTLPDGPLAFDGTDYQAITETIYGVVSYPNSERTRLTLLTLDVLSNQVNDVTDVGLKFYNESEFFVSEAVSFTCWGEFNLSDIGGGALTSGSFTDQEGLVRSLGTLKGAGHATLVGLVEAEEDASIAVSPGTCSQVASACNLVQATCTKKFPPRDTVCNPLVQCAVVTSIACTACRDAYAIATGAEAGCNLVPATCTVIQGACSVVNATTSVSALREYAYPLQNDSMPVATTFVPFP